VTSWTFNHSLIPPSLTLFAFPIHFFKQIHYLFFKRVSGLGVLRGVVSGTFVFGGVVLGTGVFGTGFFAI
jgi:hypothetical protein